MSDEEKQIGSIPLYMEPWLQNNNPIWIGTTLTLARNIENFFFPHLLDIEKQKQLYSLLSGSLSTLPQFQNGVLKRGDECLPSDKEYLIEHFFLPFNQLQSFSGGGFLLNSQGSLLSAINFDNHFTLYGVDKNGSFEKLYLDMATCENAIQKNLGYSFSNRFGFLTAHSEMSGTGLKVRALLQLSALIHTKELKAILEQEAKEDIEVQPAFQENEWTQDLVAVENRFCLGATEESILASVRLFCERLIDIEQKRRQQIIKSNSDDLKDKVSRAFAILKHSYQIEAKEAMNALSLIKFGLTLGWIQNITLEQLNELFFIIRRAHFIKHLKKEMDPTTLLHERATFLQEKLSKVEITI
jgi:protein arginine kinase